MLRGPRLLLYLTSTVPSTQVPERRCNKYPVPARLLSPSAQGSRHGTGTGSGTRDGAFVQRLQPREKSECCGWRWYCNPPRYQLPVPATSTSYQLLRLPLALISRCSSPLLASTPRDCASSNRAPIRSLHRRRPRICICTSSCLVLSSLLFSFSAIHLVLVSRPAASLASLHPRDSVLPAICTDACDPSTQPSCIFLPTPSHELHQQRRGRIFQSIFSIRHLLA